jgi:hypothetical protein
MPISVLKGVKPPVAKDFGRQRFECGRLLPRKPRGHNFHDMVTVKSLDVVH